MRCAAVVPCRFVLHVRGLIVHGSLGRCVLPHTVPGFVRCHHHCTPALRCARDRLPDSMVGFTGLPDCSLQMLPLFTRSFTYLRLGATRLFLPATDVACLRYVLPHQCLFLRCSCCCDDQVPVGGCRYVACRCTLHYVPGFATAFATLPRFLRYLSVYVDRSLVIDVVDLCH